MKLLFRLFFLSFFTISMYSVNIGEQLPDNDPMVLVLKKSKEREVRLKKNALERIALSDKVKTNKMLQKIADYRKKTIKELKELKTLEGAIYRSMAPELIKSVLNDYRTAKRMLNISYKTYGHKNRVESFREQYGKQEFTPKYGISDTILSRKFGMPSINTVEFSYKFIKREYKSKEKIQWEKELKAKELRKEELRKKELEEQGKYDRATGKGAIIGIFLFLAMFFFVASFALKSLRRIMK